MGRFCPGLDLGGFCPGDILISWFVIILALLGVASLFLCCMIHCKHLHLSDANKLTYLLTYLLTQLLVSDLLLLR